MYFKVGYIKFYLVCTFFLFCFCFNFIFKLYIIVLVLPNIKMNPPQVYAAAAAKAFQSCPTLCDPVDGSPPGPAVPGVL